ncbi:transcriptional regulator [Bifidobacterium stellenboschense]|uniref:Transcriptional regulator n=2 Tax=Bifidobacterium stellenboschense TaxID=762211 RepID=A0A087DMV1_9BIFI|nr:transcriptional regulator [Bifidobacterium stellenboschense]
MRVNSLRRIIGTYQSSDRNLLELTDEELEQALQLTVTVDGKIMPTLTGLLLLGKEESLKRFSPTHRAFREALVNAFGHRDHTLLGRVRVQLDDA